MPKRLPLLCLRAVLLLCLGAALAVPGLVSPAAASARQAKGVSGGRESAKAASGGETAPKTAAGTVAAKAGQKPAPKPAMVTGVRQVSGKDYSRIVISLSRETSFRYLLLPAGNDDVRRLYVDMDDTRVKSGVPDRFTVTGGVMRKVRVSPNKPGVVRVVVDTQNLTSYKVFTLDGPFRVVVDVQGEIKKTAPSKEQAGPQPATKTGKPGGAAFKDSGATGQEAQSRPDARPGGKGRAKASENSAKAPPVNKKMAKQLVEQLGLTVRTVMIDPGHGGKDPGARSKNGLLEKNVTLRVAKLLGKLLKAKGFNVLYTRTTDTFIPLESRTAMANAQKADLFLAIHCNAHSDPGSSGLETYSLNLATTPEEVRIAARENAVDQRSIGDLQSILADIMLTSRLTESRDFAKAAHQTTLLAARKTLPMRDRGLHEAPFYVLMGANMPAVLIEIGYITNPVEAAKFNDGAYLEQLAKGLAEGVAAYKQRVERYAAKE